MNKDTKTTHTYYQLVGTIDGIQEVIWGSYDKTDVEFEMGCERDSLKDQGYKKIKIISSATTEEPSPDVYNPDSRVWIPSEAFRSNTTTPIDTNTIGIDAITKLFNQLTKEQ